MKIIVHIDPYKVRSSKGTYEVYGFKVQAETIENLKVAISKYKAFGLFAKVTPIPEKTMPQGQTPFTPDGIHEIKSQHLSDLIQAAAKRNPDYVILSPSDVQQLVLPVPADLHKKYIQVGEFIYTPLGSRVVSQEQQLFILQKTPVLLKDDDQLREGMTVFLKQMVIFHMPSLLENGEIKNYIGRCSTLTFQKLRKTMEEYFENGGRKAFRDACTAVTQTNPRRRNTEQQRNDTMQARRDTVQPNICEDCKIWQSGVGRSIDEYKLYSDATYRLHNLARKLIALARSDSDMQNPQQDLSNETKSNEFIATLCARDCPKLFQRAVQKIKALFGATFRGIGPPISGPPISGPPTQSGLPGTIPLLQLLQAYGVTSVAQPDPITRQNMSKETDRLRLLKSLTNQPQLTKDILEVLRGIDSMSELIEAGSMLQDHTSIMDRLTMKAIKSTYTRDMQKLYDQTDLAPVHQHNRARSKRESAELAEFKTLTRVLRDESTGESTDAVCLGTDMIAMEAVRDIAANIYKRYSIYDMYLKKQMAQERGDAWQFVHTEIGTNIDGTSIFSRTDNYRFSHELRNLVHTMDHHVMYALGDVEHYHLEAITVDDTHPATGLSDIDGLLARPEGTVSPGDHPQVDQVHIDTNDPDVWMISIPITEGAETEIYPESLFREASRPTTERTTSRSEHNLRGLQCGGPVVFRGKQPHGTPDHNVKVVVGENGERVEIEAISSAMWLRGIRVPGNITPEEMVERLTYYDKYKRNLPRDRARGSYRYNEWTKDRARLQKLTLSDILYMILQLGGTLFGIIPVMYMRTYRQMYTLQKKISELEHEGRNITLVKFVDLTDTRKQLVNLRKSVFSIGFRNKIDRLINQSPTSKASSPPSPPPPPSKPIPAPPRA